jgi:nitroreductase
VDFFDVIYSQRAIRSFKPDPVPQELIEKVIESATKAPSGGNTQPWAFVVVRDSEKRAELAALARAQFQVMYDGALSRQKPGDPPPFPRLKPMVESFEKIPVLIYPCLVAPEDAPPERIAMMYGSIYPAVQNLLLAACALGLGAAFTGMTASTAASVLKLPPTVRPVAMVPLGYPDAEHYGPTTRRPVAEVLHWDEWSERETTDQRVGGH